MYIAVCDDDPYVCQQLQDFLNVASFNLHLAIHCAVFMCGQDFIRFLDTQAVDLVFLDIELVGMNGIEIGKLLREGRKDNHIHIVYISSKEHYALQLFKMRPTDFIVKPFNQSDIEAVVRTVQELCGEHIPFFEFSINHNTKKVALHNILYFEGVARKVIMTTHTQNEIFYGTLTDILKRLLPDRFVSIHKSFIVNYQYVEAWNYKEMVMVDGRVLPVSQAKRKELRQWLLENQRREFAHD